MINIRILITIVLLCPTPAVADIFQKVGEDGVIHFTNTPTGRHFNVYLREAPPPLPDPPAVPPAAPSEKWVLEYASKMSRANNLEPALVKAIIKAESNGDRRAVSMKGAMGMMQLMPFTSRRFNVKDPFDPIENIEGGVRYIRELLDDFQGNLTHAVAAYNAGPEAVRRHNGVPPYKETRQYVKRVMDYYRRYSTVE